MDKELEKNKNAVVKYCTLMIMAVMIISGINITSIFI